MTIKNAKKGAKVNAKKVQARKPANAPVANLAPVAAVAHKKIQKPKVAKKAAKKAAKRPAKKGAKKAANKKK